MANKNLFSGKAVQHGLERIDTGRMQSLWIELPGYCNLACSYCYANGGKPEFPEKLMTKEDYLNILNEARELGVDSIGIPGAGEPFLPRNRALTMWFLSQCAERGMFVTLFTTGEWIDEELARELYELPVELMIKGNSLDPNRQDEFVSSSIRQIRGYGAKRNACIELLMQVGFNKLGFGRKSRMALVTSVMTDQEGNLSNIDEMEEIYRFCRDRNIIADIDTVLKRGRACQSGLSADEGRILQMLVNLRCIAIEEYGDELSASSSTYVGTVCDRYHHHLYIDQYGQIRPCIGAMGVNLGNIREGTTLAEAWESVERRIIRSRQFDGPCTSCVNFQEGNCNSCLGRYTPDEGKDVLTNESLLRDGCVHTTGCSLFRQGK